MAGALTHTPARVLAQALVDLGLGVAPDVRDPARWSVFYGGEPPTPDEVITVRHVVGLDNGTTMWDGTLQEFYGLQVRVRASDEDSGWSRANAVMVALHALTNRYVSVDGVPYLLASAGPRGGVNSLGKADPTSALTLFTVNLLAAIDPD